MGESGWQTGARDAITDVNGIRVGHWTDRRAVTGCTVILCGSSTAATVDVRGGAPGTRETDALRPGTIVPTCHAIVFAGGSAFGLAAAGGVMRWCEEHGIGFPTTVRNVPIVPGAVLFDIGIGNPRAFPDEQAGYKAASRAKGGAVPQGSVGAGTGATVGKLLGPEAALKAGVGTASALGPRGIMAGALVVTNAVGHVFDPDTGGLIAGPRAQGGGMVSLPEALAARTARMDALIRQNTTLVCVATNAALDHNQLQRIAAQAHDGLARTIVPIHTFADGDVAFAVAMGRLEIAPDDALTVGALAVRAVERAVLKSVRLATGLAGVPSAAQWRVR
ncbi:MAG: P1 family peptidase [Tepidiformaceae bacterium]